MVNPKEVYHGSGKMISGDLIPRQARDLDKNKIHNNLKGIYASSVKEQAIAMAMQSLKECKEGEMKMHKVNGKLAIQYSIIHKGWPRQKNIYLYTLPVDSFVNRPKGSAQWISFEPVRPKKVEKLSVKKYIHLVRKPTEKEAKAWIELKRKVRKNNKK